MNRKLKNKDIITFPLPPHALKGGYIYIPTKYRNRFPNKSFIIEFRYKEQHFKSDVSIDSVGRLRAIQSSESLFNLSEWFQTYKIKSQYIVSVYHMVLKEEDSKWQIIITPPEFSKEYSKSKAIIPAPTNEFLEIGAFIQEVGMPNVLKGGELLNNIYNLASEAYEEVLDPTRVIKASVKECIRESQQDLQLLAFFQMFWESETVRRLFSNRAEDLFPQMLEDEDEDSDQSSNYLLYFPITSPLTENDMAVVKAINDRIILELSHRYQSLLQLVKRLAYQISDTISERKDLDDEIADANAKIMFAELLELVEKEIKKDKIRNDIQQCVKDAVRDWGWLIPRILWFINEIQIKTTQKWMDELSSRCQLDAEIIYEALNELIEKEVVRPIATIFWCSNHTKQPQYHVSVGIGSSISCYCSICKGEMKQLKLAPLHPSIMKFLKHHDGLPLIASSWLAEQQNIKWNTNHIFDGGEIDLWIADRKGKKAAIFEFWMTNVGADSRAFNRRLKPKIHQLDIAVRNLNGSIEGIPIVEKFVVVNINESVIKRLQKRKENNANFQVISIDDVYSTITNYNV